MQKQSKDIMRFGIIAVLVCLLCVPMVLAFSHSVSTDDDYADDDALVMEALIPVEVSPKGMTSEGMAAEAIVAATPWGAPVLVSPNSGANLFHYPRKTTLSWQPVTGAISYRVERQYNSGTWTSYSPGTVTGINNTSYTFDFVGDQQGRWRVSAFNGTTYSPASMWWYFRYSTSLYISTPFLTTPAANENFYHFPRNLTLSWKPVPEAEGYKVEVQYCQAGVTNCQPWVTTTVGQTNEVNAYHNFNFVGAQPGRWRVTALGGDTYRDSPPSAWRIFYFHI
jgi:hypothetical protein